VEGKCAGEMIGSKSDQAFGLTRKRSEIDAPSRRACYEIAFKNNRLRNAKLSSFIGSQ
jgi:hypothetical protein